MAQEHRPERQSQVHALATYWPFPEFLGPQGKEPTHQLCHRLLETWCQSALGNFQTLPTGSKMAASGVDGPWEESLGRAHCGW